MEFTIDEFIQPQEIYIPKLVQITPPIKYYQKAFMQFQGAGLVASVYIKKRGNTDRISKGK
jgi:hypothetical protein